MSANPTPTMKEEIIFKVIETAESLFDDHSNGLITSAQLDTGIKTLIKATGWAVGKTIFSLLSDELVEVDESFSVKRVFTNGDKFAIVSKIPIKSLVELNLNGITTNHWNVTNDNIQDTFDRVCQKILASKYREIK